MPSVKEYNQKLVGLRNMHKLTRTMSTVSASKLRRVHLVRTAQAAYATELLGLVGRLRGVLSQLRHPLLNPRAAPRSRSLLIICSDRGLCGSFNNNLLRAAEGWLVSWQQAGFAVTVSCCGQRGWQALRRRMAVARNYEGVMHRPTYRDAETIGNDLITAFTGGLADEVYLGFNHYCGPLKQVPVCELLLPFGTSLQAAAPAAPASDYLVAPDEATLMNLLLPKLLRCRVLCALLESAAGEHAARMAAMDNAAKNVESLIEDCMLRRNQLRQSAITRELIEIISGAEAL